MNTRNYKFVTLAVLVFLFFNLKATAQVGIGTTTPNVNAMLDVDVSNLGPAAVKKGFLPPRMLTTEKTTLGTALLTAGDGEGMLVYDTDLGEYSMWDGTAWVAIGGAATSSNSIGSLYLNTGGSTTSAAPSGTKINGSTTADHLQDFTSVVDNQLVYIGADTKIFTVHMSMAYQRLTNTTIEDTMIFYVSKNGAPVTSVFNPNILPAIINTNQSYNVTIMGTVELATGDFIEAYALAIGAGLGSDINVINMNLVLTD